MTPVDRLRALLGHWGANIVQLRSYAGVARVDVGYRYVGGQRTDDVAVRLFIRGRKRREGDNLAPRSVGPLPLDVIETSFLPHCADGNPPHPERLRAPHLVGGLSIGTLGMGAVTLGVVVESARLPGSLALTAMHVGVIGDRVLQPAPDDAEDATGIGAIVAGGEGGALIQLDAPVPAGDVMGLGRLRGCVSEEELHELWGTHARVTKSGRTTGVTSAIIDGIAGDGTVTLRPAAEGRDLACGGDSGAIWMTPGGRGVAIHSGGDDATGFAAALYRVVAELEIRLAS